MKILFALILFPVMSFAASTAPLTTTTNSSSMMSRNNLAQKAGYLFADIAGLAGGRGHVGAEAFVNPNFAVGFSLLSYEDKVKETIFGQELKVGKHTTAYGVGGTYYFMPPSNSLNYFVGASMIFATAVTPTKNDAHNGFGIKAGAMFRMNDSVAFQGGLFGNSAQDDFKTEAMLALAIMF
jgi:hypothetical protein